MLISLTSLALASALAQSAPAAFSPEDQAWRRRMDAWVQAALDRSPNNGDLVGVVSITALIDAQGRPVVRDLAKSSGCADLDAEALDDLTAIASAPVAPQDLQGRTFVVQLRFRPPPEDLASRQAFWRVQCH